MALQFIFGNSGSGKSHVLYRQMITEAGQHPERSYLVIVPEQFTLQTQRDLVMRHPDGGIMNLEVLSFARLAHRIFEEVGTDRRSVLTETGKNLMLRRLASQENSRLQVLGGQMNRPGCVSEVKSLISELMQYEVTDFDLQELLKFVEGRPLLHAKLSDIRLLYREFLAYQRDRFMKPEELLEVLCQMAGRSALLKRSILALDGFAGFTPVQLKVLEELLVICPKVYLTVTIDAREPFFGEIREHELFAPARRLIRSAAEAAGRAAARTAGRGEMLEQPMVLGQEAPLREEAMAETAGSSKDSSLRDLSAGHPGNRSRRLPRYKEGGALMHLEQNLFRNVRRPYREEPEEISLHVAQNPAQEVHFAARTICSLVRSGAYRCREIAVITGDLGAYDNYVTKIFPMYGLPFFLDETRRILLNPCLEFVRGAIDAARLDFSAGAVFRLLRTGMAGPGPEETDRLENYVIAAGVRGRRKWESPWTWCPRGTTPEELAWCNQIRADFMERFGAFAETMQKKNLPLKEYAAALWRLLEDCGVWQQLQRRRKLLEEQGAMEEASAYEQVYPILIRLLDEMAELLGEERMNCREFAEILDAGLSEAKVGMIPPGIDQIQVGDIERSRLSDIRVLFFLGLNDGWVPARAAGGGIVTQQEREVLVSGGIRLAPSERENSYIQRFYLYQNLTKPGDRLYLSWCESGADGKAMRPSYLVSTVCSLFPKLRPHREGDAGTEFSQITSKENGMLYFLHGLQKIREKGAGVKWLALYRLYLKDEAYRPRVRRLVAAAFLRGQEAQLTPETAKQLYQERMTAGVTRLELFASCAFAHFVSYGLRLQERQEYGVKAVDLGVLFHRAMQLFSETMYREGLDWGDCPVEEQQERMDRSVDQAAAEYESGLLHAGAREAYTIRRLKRILRRTVWAVQRQMKSGKFRPSGFEISFSDTGNLDAVRVRFGQNGSMRLLGRIDRIDTAQEEDSVYVKVVDYKSGMASFDPVAFYYGLQLQLAVYLQAALEMEQKLHPDRRVIPAGTLYYRMQDPVLDKAGTRQEAEQNLRKKLRPEGLLNADPAVLKLLDEGIGGESLVIRAGIKKDGTAKAGAGLITSEQFSQMLRYTSKLLKQLGVHILDGTIAARPFADQDGSACDYCPYADVCGLDRRLPGQCEKRIAELSAGDVWARLKAEDDG